MTRDEFVLYARKLIDDAGDALSDEPWQGYREVSTDGVDVAINALASAYASAAAERDALRAEVDRLRARWARAPMADSRALDAVADRFDVADDAACDAMLATYTGTLTEMMVALTITLRRAERLPSRDLLVRRACAAAVEKYGVDGARKCMSGLGWSHG